MTKVPTLVKIMPESPTQASASKSFAPCTSTWQKLKVKGLRFVESWWFPTRFSNWKTTRDNYFSHRCRFILHLSPSPPLPHAQLRSQSVSNLQKQWSTLLPWAGQKRPEVAGPSHLFLSLPLAFCGVKPIINQAVKQRKYKNCLGKNSYLFKIKKKKPSPEKTETRFQYTEFDYLALNKGI